MTATGIGALLGLSFALGLVLIVTRLGALRRPSLFERIVPFVPVTRESLARTSVDPGPVQVLIAVLQPLIRDRKLTNPIEDRLANAGRNGVDQFRLEQAISTGIGASFGLVAGLWAAASGTTPISILIFLMLGAGFGAVFWNRHLTHLGNLRKKRIAQQLPAVAELLAFAVAAGESPVAAIERVSVSMAGELADEFHRALSEIRAGTSVEQALREVAQRTASADIERFIDGILLAIERGSPLAEVLRAQAADARAADRRLLLESAGRKDVAMLIPVVFFILPTVVLIAIFPGIQGLKLIVS
ncbi:MAG: pilus assembly protein TadB [Actinobacteria bacterium]|uniref:Unannotated protein n=1 Tax=freshwater metagenome TaxID=449393 RepID=A0A6J7SPL4_9ZZZZ|nr:pilus assembly protein TadB [Actinomycetota bacterium]MTB28477.1 pilus assembly protein TadB [Actinomycetota bacterium]